MTGSEKNEGFHAPSLVQPGCRSASLPQLLGGFCTDFTFIMTTVASVLCWFSAVKHTMSKLHSSGVSVKKREEEIPSASILKCCPVLGSSSIPTRILLYPHREDEKVNLEKRASQSCPHWAAQRSYHRIYCLMS
jgi:hypothetical protein